MSINCKTLRRFLTASKLFLLSGIIILSLLVSCNQSKKQSDASGTFEADETIISAEATGVIKELNLEEGEVLEAGKLVGIIDTVQLILKRKQLEAQIRASGNRIPDIPTQTGYFKQQKAVTQTKLNYLLHEQNRIQQLLKADAATPKQLDDINAQINEVKEQLSVISKQESAQVSAFQTQTSAIRGDVSPLYVQIEQTNDLLQKCRIINPLNGTVLTKYANKNEVAAAGKPLYKIADLTTINLRAYITGNQLSQVKLNQKVTVKADDGKGDYKVYTGIVEWISNKAEFTPKTIQTKDERANLVYAVKINIHNDGLLKIGMYGEVDFK